MAVAAGDQAAFGDLYDQIAAQVYAIMTVLGSDSDAVDATARALLEIWRTAPRYTPSDVSARAWCLNVAYRHAINSHHRQHHRKGHT